MTFFDLVIIVAMVATGALLYAAIRGLQRGTMSKHKAYLMIAVAIITVLNLYMWITMPAI